jgi:hypothetical protein
MKRVTHRNAPPRLPERIRPPTPAACTGFGVYCTFWSCACAAAAASFTLPLRARARKEPTAASGRVLSMGMGDVPTVMLERRLRSVLPCDWWLDALATEDVLGVARCARGRADGLGGQAGELARPPGLLGVGVGLRSK